MNKLEQQQNSPANLRWLAASSDRYGCAKKLFACQAILSVIIPILLTLTKFLYPQASSWAALYGVIIATVDLFLIDTYIKVFLKEGALAQECFDCSVLELTWNKEEFGTPPSNVKEIEWSERYLKKFPNQPQHKDWYPPVAGNIPIQYGRLICQLSSCNWDERLRKHYSLILFGSVAFVILIIFIICFMINTTVITLTLTLSALQPAIIWFLRGWRAQVEIREKVRKQRERIENLWDRALRDEVPDNDLDRAVRSIQDDIFVRRKTSQPIFNCIYKLFRPSDQKNMIKIAEIMVRAYQTHKG